MMPRSQIIMNILLIPTVLFVALSIVMLLIRVLVDIFAGRTQIESWEIDRVKSLVRRRLARKVGFPYDIDEFTNLTDALGSPLTWLLPWGKPKGDGLHFAKNDEAKGGAVWPPDHRDQGPPSERTLAARSAPTTMGSAHARFRRNRAPGDPNAFFRREEWENFEGEKLTDFGVDMDAEMSVTSVESPALEPNEASEDIPLQTLLSERSPGTTT